MKNLGLTELHALHVKTIHILNKNQEYVKNVVDRQNIVNKRKYANVQIKNYGMDKNVYNVLFLRILTKYRKDVIHAPIVRYIIKIIKDVKAVQKRNHIIMNMFANNVFMDLIMMIKITNVLNAMGIKYIMK